MNFLVSGGTGFIGSQLVDYLVAKNHSVKVLTRRAGAAKGGQGLSFVPWKISADADLIKHVSEAQAVVNLAGESVVAKRWTRAQKNNIIASRLKATRALVEAIAHSPVKPAVLVSASAIGFYGAQGDHAIDESATRGAGFLAETCQQWENEALKAEDHGVRVVCLRIGVVLGHGGGALAKMLPPFRFFLGGPLGSGKQWVSWIHLQDLAAMAEHAAKNPAVRGAVNATAPYPVTMKDFSDTLGRALGRPSFMPVPEFALKILLGELSTMLTTGQRVLPKKIKENGFAFKFQVLERALEDLVR